MPPTRNLIQNPELLRRLHQVLELRQQHIAPTLNEGVQPVVLLADIARENPIPVRDVFGYTKTLTNPDPFSGVILLNPRESGVVITLRSWHVQHINEPLSLVNIEMRLHTQTELEAELGGGVGVLLGVRFFGARHEDAKTTLELLQKIPRGELRHTSAPGGFVFIGGRQLGRWAGSGVSQVDPVSGQQIERYVEQRPFVILPGGSISIQNLNSYGANNGTENRIHWTEQPLEGT